VSTHLLCRSNVACGVQSDGRLVLDDALAGNDALVRAASDTGTGGGDGGAGGVWRPSCYAVLALCHSESRDTSSCDAVGDGVDDVCGAWALRVLQAMLDDVVRCVPCTRTFISISISISISSLILFTHTPSSLSLPLSLSRPLSFSA
jgi:hypothetical protein